MSLLQAEPPGAPASAKKRLLIVYHSQTGNTERMAEAAWQGARSVLAVHSVLQRAFATTVADLLIADALLIGTPENFGTMSGAVKDLFDRTYYPAEGRMRGRPYAVFISAGNDGRGAAREIARIATGYGWREVQEPFIARKALRSEDLETCREIGAALAAGLEIGVF